jgi:predicted component of type VI protein secretion system
MMDTNQQHTIILVQFTKTKKVYNDFVSIPLAIDYVIGLYESRLKELNPTVENINYTVKVSEIG